MAWVGKMLSIAAAAAAALLGIAGLAQAQNPVPAAPAPVQTAPAEASPAQPNDPFGEEVMLTPKSIVFVRGTTTWDTAFDTLVDAFKSVYTALDAQGLKAVGSAMTIYTSTDDTGFQFQAAVPVAEEPKEALKGEVAFGKSPAGKAIKFIHRGSYDAMDTTYDAITNFLDEKKLEAKDLFVEQYLTDPLTTPEDKLVVEVYVPVK
ncbi:MAG TPA: GyrI-like domain-containing protein [Xanthobacteraceae bacterium]|jgi:effector-binding domain-containing protein|nr:GyrI-like domain-containing protein [Xanthobacteraceae bacterium]